MAEVGLVSICMYQGHCVECVKISVPLRCATSGRWTSKVARVAGNFADSITSAMAEVALV
jgi:hypothetical protein